MAQGWRSSEERPSLESLEPGLATSRRKSRLALIGNKRLTVADSVLIIIILPFTSHRLTAEGYSFQKAVPSSPDAEEVLATDPPVHSPDIPISTEKATAVVENRVLANLVPIIFTSP